MKIHNINNYFNYKNNNKPIKNDESIKNKKYDIIDIKHTNKDVNLEKIKSDIIKTVNKDTSSEKIERIQSSINNKTYEINVDEIVKKLLDK